MKINYFAANFLALQSSDNGLFIGGTVAGICLLIAIFGACILTAKSRRQSFSG